MCPPAPLGLQVLHWFEKSLGARALVCQYTHTHGKGEKTPSSVWPAAIVERQRSCRVSEEPLTNAN